MQRSVEERKVYFNPIRYKLNLAILCVPLRLLCVPLRLKTLRFWVVFPIN